VPLFSAVFLRYECARATVYDAVSGRPAQPTLPLTRLLKLGQVKHSTKETLFCFTGQSTASFFIFARAFPFTAPLIASRLSLGAGIVLEASTTSTVYLSSVLSLKFDHAIQGMVSSGEASGWWNLK
jgi:hypothetical protein